jgi:hypothetical protein
MVFTRWESALAEILTVCYIIILILIIDYPWDGEFAGGTLVLLFWFFWPVPVVGFMAWRERKKRRNIECDEMALRRKHSVFIQPSTTGANSAHESGVLADNSST